MTRVALALVHHPVLDRGGGVVTTAITNLDLHDMSRSARTYGLEAMIAVHPVEAQRKLATRIREHWVAGSGRRRIPDRGDALERLRVVASLEDAYAELAPSALGSPATARGGIELWTTAASAHSGAVTSWSDARVRLEAAARPVLIAFGTGWGLAPEVVAGADVRLAPIRARADTGYNHLSVRAACAIVLDRLLG